MALARWNGVVQDAEGNAVSGAQIEVRNEATGGLAPLYADRDGAVGLGNPYVAPGAEIAFHARGGNYRITASKGSELKTWRWVAIGTSQGVDVEDLIVGLQAGIITAQTLAELDANAPETPDPGITPAPRGGVVWNDPSPALNGYYTYNYTETAWEYARPLPDTFAKVLLSGTGTAQTGVLAAGVSPAGIEVFFAKVGVPNTGALTLSINGGAVRQVVNLAGNPLSAGEWTGMVMFYLNEDGQYQLLIDAGAAASASQSATEAYADRLLAEAAAEAAQSVSQTLPIVATRVGLKALDYELLPHAILTEGTDDRFSRHGSFSWVAGDFTAQVAADLQEGIFIASASDPIGAAGCWVRDRNSENEYNVCWFGAVGINSSAYSADNHAAFQGFVNLARALGRRNNPLTIPGGDYRVGDEIECFRTTSPRVDISFNGAGEHETRILSDFFGSDTLGARSTDVKMFNIRIADFEGVAMAFNNMQQLVITGVKVEGISTSISSGHVSCGSAVFDDCGAEVFGYDCSTHSSAGRARIWAADQRNMLNIYGLTTRNFRSGYEKALWLRPVIESGGGVCVTNFSCSWNVPNNDFLFQDDSSVRSLLVRGLILATTDKAAALGFNSEVSVDGDVKAARRLVTLAGILELGAQVTSGTIPNGCIGRTSGGLAYRNGAGALFTINLTAV